MNSTANRSPTRRRILIDSGVQGTLVRRTALYATGTAIYLLVIFILSDTLSHPEEPVSESLLRCLDEAIFWVPGLMLLAPLFAYDLINISNRFVGPMFRLRRELRRLANGETVGPMFSRQGDFWADASESFNRLREELIELRALTAETRYPADLVDTAESNASPALNQATPEQLTMCHRSETRP
ncbi:MAG: hypothetical protein CMM05_05700 [Rhodopirellula sp.]|nr:hypothetical protein [Rhodopirellula sp.]